MKKLSLLFICLIALNNISGQNKFIELSGMGLSVNKILEDGLNYPVLAKANLNTRVLNKINIRFSAGKYGKSVLINENTGFETLISISGHTVAISGYADFLELGPFNLQFGGGMVGGNSKHTYTLSTIEVLYFDELKVLQDLKYENSYGLGFEVYGGIACKITPFFSLEAGLNTCSMYGIETYGKFYYTGITFNYLIHNDKKDEK